ncbi:MAG: STAS domain-containing protein [archaeon]
MKDKVTSIPNDSQKTVLEERVIDNLAYCIFKGNIGEEFSTELNPRIPEIIKNTFANNSVDGLVVDMADVKYVNSTGLGAIVNLYTKTRGLKKKFYLIMIPEKKPDNSSEEGQVKGVLRVTKLDTAAVFDLGQHELNGIIYNSSREYLALEQSKDYLRDYRDIEKWIKLPQN